MHERIKCCCGGNCVAVGYDISTNVVWECDDCHRTWTPDPPVLRKDFLKGGEFSEEVVIKLEAYRRNLRNLSKDLSKDEETEVKISGGCTCQSCGNKYKVDLNVPDEVWAEIRPKGKDKEAGLLCGGCIMERIEIGFGNAGINMDCKIVGALHNGVDLKL